MYNYTKFQEEFQKPGTTYEQAVCDGAFKSAVDDVNDFLIENKERIPTNNLKFMYDTYADDITVLYAGVEGFPTTDTIREWLEDPVYERMSQVPQTIVPQVGWPTEISDNLIEQFKLIAPVFEDFIKWRVNILLPGDTIALHYDARWEAHLVEEKYPGRKFVDKRCFIYLTDQLPGHFAYLGQDRIEYKKYDMHTCTLDRIIHGACNLGYEWRNLLLITYVEEVQGE